MEITYNHYQLHFSDRVHGNHVPSVGYGHDFTIKEIREWFADEAEGYADLGSTDKDRYRYVYHQLNYQHAFRFILDMRFDEALGLGSAYGDEFKPIIHRINHVTILDPSDAFSDIDKIIGVPCIYIKPNPKGDMPFYGNRFDLITSLGVMHHIPKKILEKIVPDTGFKVKHRSLCNFPISPKIATKAGIATYNNSFLTIVDGLLCRLFSWNLKYHRTRFYEKFGQASIYYILEK
jgi:hypothetical protein